MNNTFFAHVANIGNEKNANIMRIFTRFLIILSAWGLIDCQNRAQRNFDYCLGNI